MRSSRCRSWRRGGANRASALQFMVLHPTSGGLSTAPKRIQTHRMVIAGRPRRADRSRGRSYAYRRRCNLLNNAFKFTKSGGVTLRVLPATGGRIRFEVIDTGIGIPLEQQERLFERFVQVDNSATRQFGGTGLGTSIARDLTELMGGKIGVISAPGQGSTFWLEIPLGRPELGSAPPSWGTAKEVALLCDGPSHNSAVTNTLLSLGLIVTPVDTSIGLPPAFASDRFLALIIAMSANDAAGLIEKSIAVRRRERRAQLSWHEP